MTTRAVHATYYVAHVAKSLLWTATDLVTIYALVGLYGIDPAWAGWLFLTGLAANAGADLGVGAWLDRRPSGTPRLAMGGLAVAALAFPLTVLAAPFRWPALLAATLALRLSYAAYDVPHNALLSRLAVDQQAATRLSRGRTLGTGVAAALVGAGLHQFGDTASLPWLLAGLAMAALAGGLALMLLVRMPAAAVGQDGMTAAGLPWRFLAGSVAGVVALAALSKGMMHLPATTAGMDPGTAPVMLTAGCTATALLPLALPGPRRGLTLLASLYGAVALIGPPMMMAGGVLLPLVLGGLLSATNLIGWALMPLLAQGAGGYARYTMAGKLALGLAGLAMTAALGRDSAFASGELTVLAALASAGCLVAALLMTPPRLTEGEVQGARGG